MPAIDVEMAAQCLDVFDQQFRGVVGDLAQRLRPAGAALIEDDDAIMVGIEEPTMHRRRTGARAAMQEHHRHAFGIAALLPIEPMNRVDLQHTRQIGLDRRKYGVARHRAVLRELVPTNVEG